MKAQAWTLLFMALALASRVASQLDNGAASTAASQDTGDCAEPTRARYDREAAEAADLVVSGIAISMAPGAPTCSSTGLTVAEGAQPDNTQVLLFWVQCVHKGTVACRANEEDNTNPPRCIVAVKVPQQTTEAGQLPPCTVTRGFRYTMLLSGKPAGSCDGVYNLQNARITDSIHTHIGLRTCAPYPTWPSQDTSLNGTGLANALGQTCPGTTSPIAQCTGTQNPCIGRAACAEETAITCVPKVCNGKVMVGSTVLSPDPCQAVFISKVTGLPVSSCDVTSTRLNRQARQAEKRLTKGSGAGASSSSSSRGLGAGGIGSILGTSAGDSSSADSQQPLRTGSIIPGPSRLEPLPTLDVGMAPDSSSP